MCQLFNLGRRIPGHQIKAFFCSSVILSQKPWMNVFESLNFLIKCLRNVISPKIPWFVNYFKYFCGAYSVFSLFCLIDWVSDYPKHVKWLPWWFERCYASVKYRMGFFYNSVIAQVQEMLVLKDRLNDWLTSGATNYCIITFWLYILYVLCKHFYLRTDTYFSSTLPGCILFLVSIIQYSGSARIRNY